MTEGFIDSASTHGLEEVLTYSKPEECFTWAWRSAFTTIAALISMNNLKLSPSPTPAAEASGLYGEIMVGLSTFIRPITVSPKKAQNATVSTQQWAMENLVTIRSAYEGLKTDQVYFPRWLDHAITYAWPENTLRLGALFNIDFIVQIAKVLEVNEQDLKQVWEQSTKPEVVRVYAKKQPDDEVFKMMRDAYIISALLRGWYHEYIAQRSSLQIIHHPIRLPLLPSSKGKLHTNFPVPRTQAYLASIILAGAFAERGQRKRVASLIENLEKARKVTLRPSLNLGVQLSDEEAMSLAVEVAKKADIRTHPRWVERVLDVCTAVIAGGIGGIPTSFLFTSWESLLIGSLISGLVEAYTVTQEKTISKKVATLIFERENHLRNLAQAGPGRLEQVWE